MNIPSVFQPFHPPVARAALVCLLSASALPALAMPDCIGKHDAAERLACYDRYFGAPAESAGKDARPAEAGDLASGAQTRPQPKTGGEEAGRSASKSALVLADAWDLDPCGGRDRFELRTYKPTYLLFATYTNNINNLPQSDNPANTVTVPQGLNNTEAQYQISFKTKVAERLLGSSASIWVAYTQTSRWQVYNHSISRPFRETNYEPEAMVVVPVQSKLELDGWTLKMASLSLNHQSNGRSNPLSRSWNRIVGQLGLEKGDDTLLLRPWWRIPEQFQDDDNPRIQDYVGRGEMVYSRRFSDQVVAVQLRHSLRGGGDSRGSLRLDWSLPFPGEETSRLKLHLTAFTGYGESLIDYNHRQTVLGAGISLVDW
ncbi:MAG: phospholipase [Zoogloea sp.]|nr:phospholipase [Zoogloea sp.]